MFDIVLVNILVGVKYGGLDYLIFGCGMGWEVMFYLLECGVWLIGIDVWFWDVLFFYIV